ncbi:MAG: hypothetical protein GY913_18495 [Proteobacteria bacterium]|nr:hypothetical protein [Pseudomonadota bacterium]MCP4918900.1 hypothetical protein [Pseudomonadota bacterium]
MLLTFPALFHLGGQALGSPHGDGMKHIWTVWWIRQELLGEYRFPFGTELLNYPVGMELYPIEPLNGLFVTVFGLVGLVASANLAALVNLTLVGFVGALFGRELSKDDWGGLATGTLLQGSAFAAFTIHVGVGELQHFWWLPLGAWAWMRLRRLLGWKEAVLLGLSLAGATLSCFYHGFFLALTVAVLSLCTLWLGRRTPALLARYAVAAGLGLALIVPVMRAFASSYAASDAPTVGLSEWVLGDHGQPITDPELARLEVTDLVVPARDERATTNPQVLGYGGGRYLGILALGLLLAGVVRDPKRGLPWLAAAIVGVLFATGSFWTVDGVTVGADTGTRIRLPFFYLNRLLAYVGEGINFPVRFLAITVLSIGASAALLTRSLTKGRPLVFGLAVLCVLDVAVNQLDPRPAARFELESFPELEALAAEDAPVVDLTIAFRPDSYARRASLSAQTLHEQPIQAVPLERIEYFATEGTDLVGSLALVQALSAAADRNTPVVLDGVDATADLTTLYDAGFRKLMVLGTGDDRRLPPTVCATLDELAGPPSIDGLAVRVWDIPAP